MVNRYLSDLAQWQRDRWARGQDWSDTSRDAVRLLEEMADLDLESIATFYEENDRHEQPNPE